MPKHQKHDTSNNEEYQDSFIEDRYDRSFYQCMKVNKLRIGM